MKLVFQPFEEGGAGADILIKTGETEVWGRLTLSAGCLFLGTTFPLIYLICYL